MRTVLLLSVIAVLAACDDEQPSTAPANARAIATPTTQASVETGPVAQGKAPPPPSGWTKVTVVQGPSTQVLAMSTVGAYASCPAGTTVIAGGFLFTSEGNQAAPPQVTQNVPGAGFWFVHVVNRMPGAVDAAVRSYALCAS